MSNPGSLELRRISHSYGQTTVLKSLDLRVGPGEILCLLGASGCGKSTLLRIVAGLEPLQQGEIVFNGGVFARPGVEPPAEDRHFGLVFQDHALFPHLTVAANLAFGLATLAPAERQQRVAELLEQVGLQSFGQRYPHTLSGGQQQRVALARALAPQPRLMLLDEPFASVDATLRRRLREEARSALKDAAVPSIVVTHDAEEALELADRIAIMDQGEIVQCASPEAVWRAPANRFVAQLFGDASAIPARAVSDGLATVFGTLPLAPPAGSTSCFVLAKPDSVRVTAGNPEQDAARVADIRFLGDRYLLRVVRQGVSVRSVTSLPPDLQIGDPVHVSFDPDRTVAYT